MIHTVGFEIALEHFVEGCRAPQLCRVNYPINEGPVYWVAHPSFIEGTLEIPATSQLSLAAFLMPQKNKKKLSDTSDTEELGGGVEDG